MPDPSFLILLRENLKNEIDRLEAHIKAKKAVSKHFTLVDDGTGGKMVEELSGFYSISKAVDDILNQGEE